MIMKDKKGSVLELIFVIGVLFAIVVSILIGKVIFSEINDTGVFSTHNATSASEAQNIADNFEDNAYQAFSTMFFIIFIGMLIVLSIIAFVSRTHPAFFPISAFVVLPLVTLISAIISNVYEDFTGVNAMIMAADNSIVISQIMDFLPFYMFGFGVVLLVITYGVNKTEGI